MDLLTIACKATKVLQSGVPCESLDVTYRVRGNVPDSVLDHTLAMDITAEVWTVQEWAP